MASKNGLNRREFLKVLGAGSALAATGCSQDLPEKIIPYVVTPEDVIPGVASWYAGFCTQCSAGCGTLTKVVDGRVIKVEGNKNHPINQGGLCAIGHSSLQEVYNPDRIREPVVREAGKGFKPGKWEEVVNSVVEAIKTNPPEKKVVFISNHLSGTIVNLVEDLSKQIKNFEHIEFELLAEDELNLATEKSFGQNLKQSYDFSKAKTIVSFGADYLETWLSPVQFSRGWSENRKVGDAKVTGKIAKDALSYVAHFEPRLSLTAANADNWYMNTPGSELKLLLALLKLITDKNPQKPLDAKYKRFVEELDLGLLLKDTGIEQKVLEKLADKLLSSSPSLVVSGGASSSGQNSILISVITNLINFTLGNIGKTVFLLPTKTPAKSGYQAIKKLCSDLSTKSHNVGVVIMTGTNPAYTLPSNLEFAKRIASVPVVVSVSSQMDETTSIANYILPLSTSFESWSDAETLPGLFSLNQPAMQPLYPNQTQSLGDTLLVLSKRLAESAKPSTETAALDKNKKAAKDSKDINSKEVKEEVTSFYDYLRKNWKEKVLAGKHLTRGFEEEWLTCVEKGGLIPINYSLAAGATANVNMLVGSQIDSGLSEYLNSTLKIAVDKFGQKNVDAENKFKLLVYPTVVSRDGSTANRPWMQELGDPLTTAVWGSWVEMHPDTAESLKIKTGDVIQLGPKNKKIDVPVYLTKYIAKDLVAMPIGQGHESYGRYAVGIGANALAMLDSEKDSLSFLLDNVEIRKTDLKDEVVKTQGHDYQIGRGIVRSLPLSEFIKKTSHEHGEAHGAHDAEHEELYKKFPGVAKHHDPKALGPQPEQPQMFKQMDHPQYRWGMAIDLAACTGCSACVVACYSENNIAVVGKELSAMGRDMQWIQIQRYFAEGDDQRPISSFLPMLCQHCNNAPCEPVCPVYATYHNEQGLNTMVYNRCVGTRYCLNNCSYKVRRFNWFKYYWPEPLNWQLNPDVTVREVGIMEKCTFCVQRIREAENNAKNLGRGIQDGEVKTACESSCPTQAITFGNLIDKESRVSKKSDSPRSYKILDSQINTQPAVSYLARVHNDL